MQALQKKLKWGWLTESRIVRSVNASKSPVLSCKVLLKPFIQDYTDVTRARGGRGWVGGGGCTGYLGAASADQVL